MNGNSIALKGKINSIGASKVKLLSVERFSGERSKLKGFLSQIYFKIRQEGLTLLTAMD